MGSAGSGKWIMTCGSMQWLSVISLCELQLAPMASLSSFWAKQERKVVRCFDHTWVFVLWHTPEVKIKSHCLQCDCLKTSSVHNTAALCNSISRNVSLISIYQYGSHIHSIVTATPVTSKHCRQSSYVCAICTYVCSYRWHVLMKVERFSFTGLKCMSWKLCRHFFTPSPLNAVCCNGFECHHISWSHLCMHEVHEAKWMWLILWLID